MSCGRSRAARAGDYGHRRQARIGGVRPPLSHEETPGEFVAGAPPPCHERRTCSPSASSGAAVEALGDEVVAEPTLGSHSGFYPVPTFRLSGAKVSIGA
jgi:hypothetical protein